MTERASSADWQPTQVGPATAEPATARIESHMVLDRLMEVLEWLAIPQAPTPHFKAPRYDGTGDVETFIRQFSDVLVAKQ